MLVQYLYVLRSAGDVQSKELYHPFTKYVLCCCCTSPNPKQMTCSCDLTKWIAYSTECRGLLANVMLHVVAFI